MSKLQKLNFTTTFKGTLQLSQSFETEGDNRERHHGNPFSFKCPLTFFGINLKNYFGTPARITTQRTLHHLSEFGSDSIYMGRPEASDKFSSRSCSICHAWCSSKILGVFWHVQLLSLRICASSQKKPSWEMQNLNLHNCKMNSFFLTHHLIRASLHFHFSMLFINTNKRWTQILMQQRLFDHDKY